MAHEAALAHVLKNMDTDEIAVVTPNGPDGFAKSVKLDELDQYNLEGEFYETNYNHLNEMSKRKFWACKSNTEHQLVYANYKVDYNYTIV